MQVYSDLRELLQSLKAGTSERCCFDTYDITTEYVEFETTGDAVAAALDIFVSKWNTLYQKLVHICFLCFLFRTKKSIM